MHSNSATYSWHDCVTPASTSCPATLARPIQRESPRKETPRPMPPPSPAPSTLRHARTRGGGGAERTAGRAALCRVRAHWAKKARMLAGRAASRPADAGARTEWGLSVRPLAEHRACCPTACAPVCRRGRGLQPGVRRVGGAVAAAQPAGAVAAPLAAQHLVVHTGHVAEPRVGCTRARAGSRQGRLKQQARTHVAPSGARAAALLPENTAQRQQQHSTATAEHT